MLEAFKVPDGVGAMMTQTSDLAMEVMDSTAKGGVMVPVSPDCNDGVKREAISEDKDGLGVELDNEEDVKDPGMMDEDEIARMAMVEDEDNDSEWEKEALKDLLTAEEEEQGQNEDGMLDDKDELKSPEDENACEREENKVGIAGEKRQGARKNLFPQQKAATGRTATQRMLHNLASPRKGGIGKNKHKEKKEGGKNGEKKQLGVGTG